MIEFTIRGGICSYKSTKQITSTILITIVVFLYFSPSFIHGGSVLLYSPFWTILILHLSIIWATTWVFVPSDTLLGFLWVVVAKAALFRGLLHINAARKLDAGHSMRWQQLFLRYFLSLILLERLGGTSLSLELLGSSLWAIGYAFDLCKAYPRGRSSLDHLFQPFYLHITLGDSELNTSITVHRSRTNQHPWQSPRPNIQFWAFTLTVYIGGNVSKITFFFFFCVNPLNNFWWHA